MIEHDHVKAEPARELEWLAADSPAIDRHDEPHAFGGEIRYRLGARAIALGHAVGDVDDRFATAGVQIFAEQRRAARAVDVVVAKDGDALAALDRLPQPLSRRLHVAQAIRVRHQVAQARVEMAVNRLRRNAPPGEHAGDQLVLPADLRNGERAQLSVRVKPRPPRAPERGRFDIEEIAGRRHGPALRPAAAEAANHFLLAPESDIAREGRSQGRGIGRAPGKQPSVLPRHFAYADRLPRHCPLDRTATVDMSSRACG